LLRNLWFQRGIALLDAAAFGLLVDQAASSPIHSLAAGLIAAGILWILIAGKPVSESLFRLDHDTALLLRTIFLSLGFFIFCAFAAIMILN